MPERKSTFIGRRQFLGGLLLLPRLAAAQSLTESLAVVNAGTNVLMLSTSDGLILVDSGAPEFSPRLLKNLAGDQSADPLRLITTSDAQLNRSLGEFAGARRVRTVFNTHYHLENTGANEKLGESGAKIIAHVNTRQWMEAPYWVPAEDRYEKPRPRAAHPTETFYTTGWLKAGAEQIDYGYLLAAHTSGDIYVHFRNANALAVGGVASPERDPELDYFTGAWIGGRLDAMDRLLKLSDDKTQIVPTFGPVMSRAQLKTERDMMAAIYERTVDRVREGDGADDMLKAGVMNGLARTFKDPKKFLYDLHKGLWAHHNKLAPNVV